MSPVPPGSGSSPATAGEQYVIETLSTGIYRVYAASIKTFNAYDEEARIAWIFTEGDGTEIEVTLHSGIVSQNQPLCLPVVRELVGPGSLRGYVENLAATAFTFEVHKVKQGEIQKVTAGAFSFGGWF